MKFGYNWPSSFRYQVSRSSVDWLWRRRFFKDVYHIYEWWPCWSCDATHLYKFSFQFSLKVADSNFFSENSVLENFLKLKQCIIQLHNFR